MITAAIENNAAVMREVRELGRRLGKDGSGILRDAGLAMARSAMRLTIPMGTAGKAQKQGEGAVVGDVRRTLSVAQSSDVSIAQALAHHQGQRRNGRPPRSPAKVDVTTQVRDEIIRQQQAKVGQAKAAFGRAALEFGAPRIPKWIGRHSGKWTQAQVRARRNTPSVTIRSMLNYASDALPARLQRSATRAGFSRLRNNYRNQLRRRANQSTRRLSR